METYEKSLSFERAVRFIVLMLGAVVIWTAAGAYWVHAESADKTDKRIATVVESFKRDFPNVKFTKIDGSGIEGLFEVTIGANIVYYSPIAGKVIAGDIFDKTGMNITAEKRQILLALQEAETAKLIDTLPLDKAIKVGGGKNVVIEFTDIDCPYCRKVEEFFKKRDDITRYIFLYPLDQIHPKSAAKSKEVLCSRDPAKAYRSAMDGELDKSELKGCGAKEQDILQVLAEHKATADRMGVNGTPVLWVNKKYVNGADTQKIEKYLFSGVTGTGVIP
jgi:thiol:disulfide interchange protein DsbC